MGKVNVNFINVDTKIQELDTYTKQNLITQVENEYEALVKLLEKAEGSFKDELVGVLVKEKTAVLGFAEYIKEIYALIEKASKEFEEVDLHHADKVGKYLSE